MRQTPITFQSHGLALEGVVAVPQGLVGPCPGVVLCHPHPFFGGNMDNTVILTLAKTLGASGIATLRFNLRGVANSQGDFSNGVEELRDVAAALDVLGKWPGVNGKRLALAGYSFGAQVALRGLLAYRAAKVFVLVSPPLSSFDGAGAPNDRRPKLFLVGDKDRLVSVGHLQQRLTAFQATPVLQVVPGADHSWAGAVQEVTQRVVEFLEQVL